MYELSRHQLYYFLLRAFDYQSHLNDCLCEYIGAEREHWMLVTDQFSAVLEDIIQYQLTDEKIVIDLDKIQGCVFGKIEMKSVIKGFFAEYSDPSVNPHHYIRYV